MSRHRPGRGRGAERRQQRGLTHHALWGRAGSPLLLTESAAILIHLAGKTGRLLPQEGEGRARVFEQLFFHASDLAPAFGQSGFFRRLADDPQPLALQRFSAEAQRLLGLLDHTLARTEFAAGADFTIADIAHFGWIWRRDFAGITFDDTPHVARWYEAVSSRPAVQEALARVTELIQQS